MTSYLGKVSTQRLLRIDSTITANFESGEQATAKRVWDTWNVGESKTVKFARTGRVVKVSVRGTAYDKEGKDDGTGDVWFEFKPKK